MTDKQDIYECPYKGDCELVGCIDHKECFIKQLFDERNIAEKQLYLKNKECEELKEKLSRKKAVIDFASCPSYGYKDNAIEPTCTKTFCYDVESCEYKTMIKYEQALVEIKEIIEQGVKIHDDIIVSNQILQKCEVILDEKM